MVLIWCLGRLDFAHGLLGLPTTQPKKEGAMNLTAVLIGAIFYIGFLFFVAWWVDQRARKRNRSLVQHPFIYSLSLAVYCTAWTYFGSVGRAASGGLSFLAIYLGPSLTAPLWIFVLRKMILAISFHVHASCTQQSSLEPHPGLKLTLSSSMEGESTTSHSLV